MLRKLPDEHTKVEIVSVPVGYFMMGGCVQNQKTVLQFGFPTDWYNMPILVERFGAPP